VTNQQVCKLRTPEASLDGGIDKYQLSEYRRLMSFVVPERIPKLRYTFSVYKTTQVLAI